MNVIVANKYKDMLLSLNIEVIKSMEGVFDSNEIIDTFSNFYFDRMILDITAIKNYNDLDNLQKLSINLDMSKVILVLDDTPESESKEYLSKLISMGIYNFTRNIDGITYLLNNPNSYRDVAHIHTLVDNESSEAATVIQNTVINKVKIIGIKNLTEGAGATTLTYMMKRQLENNYKVAALEVNKRDFVFLEGEDLISTTDVDLPKELMKRNEMDIILVDLNSYADEDICDYVLYLLEPSMIKLNRLVKRDRKVFERLEGKKIILNKSFISSGDVSVFEYEAKTKVFYTIPPIDDRKIPNSNVNGLLSKLGFISGASGEEGGELKNKLLGLFKF